MVRVVDNQLLFPAIPSTFHSHPQASRFWRVLQGSTWGLDHRVWITLWMTDFLPI